MRTRLKEKRELGKLKTKRVQVARLDQPVLVISPAQKNTVMPQWPYRNQLRAPKNRGRKSIMETENRLESNIAQAPNWINWEEGFCFLEVQKARESEADLMLVLTAIN